MKRIENADMKEYTSFRAGGKADLMLIPENEEELKEAVIDADRDGGYLMLGNGTDTLVRDGGLRQTVIKLGSGFSDAEVDGCRIRVGSACLLSAAARLALENELSGMECLAGIPGSIGGAVFMNAGAYGGEMKDIVESVRILKSDGSSFYELPGDRMEFSYRHSVLKDSGDIVTSVVLKLKKGRYDDISSLMKKLMQRRKDKQPLNYPSAGSFFKRPEGYFAGKLIQDAGLKGLSVGGAQVSEKHSGFVINTGNAKAQDIIDLMHLVQNTVYDKFGVRLEPEVRIVGE